jgi:hypothetical protein
MQSDDIRVRRQTFQCLYLTQIIDLVDVVEVSLHALDCNVLVRLGRLGLKHF